jgi:hypothetical protein
VEVDRTEGCAAGTVVVLSDFSSSQIALAGLDGTPLSASFLSTASTETSGLAFALSGDVVVPAAQPESERVVLIDRYGTNVISWADPKTARVLAQLPVGTGFESNPQDYLELATDRAYVTRWGQNGDPGREPLDAGGDVLIIDPRAPAVVGRIELPAEGGLPARPSAMARFGSDIAITLQRLSDDFSEMGESVLVGVSPATDEVAWQTPLAGLKGCGAPTVSPDGRRAALACTGMLAPDGQVPNLSESALLLLDLEESPPVELARFAAADLVGEPVQSSAEWANDDLLLFKTQTALGRRSSDRLFVLDLGSGTPEELVSARLDADGGGKGLVYGSARCAPGCGDVCLLADADRGVLQRFRVVDGALRALEPIVVEDEVGLPPRYLGAF